MPVSLSKKLKLAHAQPAKKPSRNEPLWRGPLEDGITQSMIGSWLVCRERFRLRYVEGWQEADQWNHRTGYGDMWHVCEEAHADGGLDWERQLTAFCRSLTQEYRLQQDQIAHWYEVCRRQFPEYVKWWAKHPDVVERTPLFQEQVFDVKYALPSGRVVRLRGKWDSVDLIGKGKGAGIYLQENKTKGDIDENQMKRQLTFDLQTMLYLVSLQETKKQLPALWKRFLSHPILGVRYNVIRRPLSGGRGTIRKHQPTKSNPGGESDADFYQRLVDDYIAKEPEYWFMRWRVEVSQGDIDRFKRECLDPVLEQLCDWWTHIVDPSAKTFGCAGACDVYPHYRMPYGVYSPLLDGGTSSLDEMLHSGSDIGLRRADRLFKELS